MYILSHYEDTEEELESEMGIEPVCRSNVGKYVLRGTTGG
jgi:hypothetical protein